MDLTERSIETEQIYRGVLLDVRKDTVRLPDGETSGREWLKHPGAGAAVPVDAQGRVVLLRQFRFAPGREFWEVPAGKRDGDEAPLAVAQRELVEEAGLTATRWTPLGVTYPAIGYSDEAIHLYLAEDLTPADSAVDADEFVEPFRMPLAEAVELARTGQIEDAKTCVALLLAAAEIERRG
ncbi:NUDIX domain-containing protein [Rubrivirga sp. IMCC45206]|uniref:NUDIX domain-containing protein n=1 Tax=Rubrivirga sp. IMCC45206 TaxID=3391614 RepID=UPI0039900B83